MVEGLTTVRAEIVRIDREIDAVKREVHKGARFDARRPEDWASHWDRHPDLRERERALFWQRGDLQIQRNRLERERAARHGTAARAKKCPTCRGTGRAS